MGFENTCGGCFNQTGVSQVQSGYVTLVYNPGDNNYVKISQTLDRLARFGETQTRAYIEKGSAATAIGEAKNFVDRMPGAKVQLVNAATGEVMVVDKKNVKGISAYEMMLKAKERTGRQTKSMDDIARKDAYVDVVMLDPTTSQGARRVTVAFEANGTTMYRNGNYYAKDHAGKIGVNVHRYADKAELEAEIAAERKSSYLLSADEVPSLY